MNVECSNDKVTTSFVKKIRAVCDNRGECISKPPICMYDDDVLSITRYYYDYEVVVKPSNERVFVGGRNALSAIFLMKSGPWETHIEELYSTLSEEQKSKNVSTEKPELTVSEALVDAKKKLEEKLLKNIPAFTLDELSWTTKFVGIPEDGE